MYKITINETVGEIVKETVIETDDIELTKQILVSRDILAVETDTPNQSIDENWQTLQEIWKAARKPPKPYDPLQPYRDSGNWPFGTPFTVTC
jgi:hypothetical protein